MLREWTIELHAVSLEATIFQVKDEQMVGQKERKDSKKRKSEVEDTNENEIIFFQINGK